MMGNPQPTVPVINSTPWSLNSQPNRVYIQHKIGKTKRLKGSMADRNDG